MYTTALQIEMAELLIERAELLHKLCALRTVLGEQYELELEDVTDLDIPVTLVSDLHI